MAWLDQHKDAVVAVATVVNVLVAIVYAFFTWGLWRQARHQASQTRAMFEATNRPWLSIEPVRQFGFSEAGVRLDFRLRNHGHGRRSRTRGSSDGAWVRTTETLFRRTRTLSSHGVFFRVPT